MSVQKSNPIERYGSKDSENYQYFANDFLPHRLEQWNSIWLQASPAITNPEINSVLEFGGGRDVTKALVQHFGIQYLSVDVSDRFFPDKVSSILEYPFQGKKYDLVCSFQALEHNPFDEAINCLRHMANFSNKFVYISVPFSGGWFSIHISMRLPKVNFKKILSWTQDKWGGRKIDTKNFYTLPLERKHGPHWWELGRRGGLTRKEFIKLARDNGLDLVETYNNPLYPHHVFFMFRVTK